MASPTAKGHLFQHYFNSGYSYDELLAEDGNLRPHWESFFQSFRGLGADEIRDRNQDLTRLLKENGVTYNVYGDPAGFNRPWKLDPIPFLITRQEWQTIESGLVQRAVLLDMILKDIYGPRLLIRNGLLPMELVYSHPGFLRQCAGISLPGKHSLILYAADIARGSDGKIWIVNDRTQAPSGSGYALENRMAMARILPELFNGFKVRRTVAWFEGLRSALEGMAPPQNPSSPRIVILTPGPGNETYFEHSFLSSFLGFTLVEGNDLIVKDNYVWIKTLGGLEKVDTILRRVDDTWCDPLELRADSQLGVPGLLNAVRSGHVSIANPLGSGILENPGLMPFLQPIARHLMGMDLIMPTIASWWCGQPRELAYTLEHLHTLVIKRIYKDAAGSTSIDASALSQQQLQHLKQQIKAHPSLYVGQEKIHFSSTPALVKDKIEPRSALFRSFLVSNGETYTAMTGGLTRSSAEQGNFVISNQRGGISKDTWIISPEPGRTLNLSKELAPAAIRHSPGGMLPSHTAENLFWVGRHAERVLGNARFQRTVMQFLAEGNRLLTEKDPQAGQDGLLKALTRYTFTYPGFFAAGWSSTEWPSTPGGAGNTKAESPGPERAASGNAKAEGIWKELRDLLFNDRRTGSLGYNLSLFSQAVYAVRDHWSADTWRVLRTMEEEWGAAAYTPATGHGKMLDALNGLITSMVAFIGLNRESISREQGWVMLDTGRKIEQSLLLVNLLRATLVDRQEGSAEYNLQEAVLVSNESLVNYRYKYKAPIQLPLVLDLMLLDPNNPRSLIYQLERLKTYLSDLPRPRDGNALPHHALSDHERLVWEAYSMLKLSDRDQLSLPDPLRNNPQERASYDNLESFLSKMYSLLLAIPDTISKTYFKHARTQKNLFTAGPLLNVKK